VVKAYYPEGRYVALSVTGTRCELRCRYCGGRYLRGMIDASNPFSFEKLLRKLYSLGVRGFLISGGFTKDGYLMISEEHLTSLKRFVRWAEDDVVVSAHLGLAPERLLMRAMDAGINVLDFEVPPSDRYLREVKRLGRDHSVGRYVSYVERCMREYGRESVAPHVVACSSSAKPEEEEEVIKELSTLNPYVMVVLFEIGGGVLDMRRAEAVLTLSRKFFNEVSLGCMRPPQAKHVEVKWLARGLVDRVAVPRKDVVKSLGLDVIRACCSLPERFERLFRP